MIEINWGHPLRFVVSDEGDILSFSTIEKAKYWLERKWPVEDVARNVALCQIEAAMDCLAPVQSARQAFLAAAATAGFAPAQLGH